MITTFIASINIDKFSEGRQNEINLYDVNLTDDNGIWVDNLMDINLENYHDFKNGNFSFVYDKTIVSFAINSGKAIKCSIKIMDYSNPNDLDELQQIKRISTRKLSNYSHRDITGIWTRRIGERFLTKYIMSNLWFLTFSDINNPENILEAIGGSYKYNGIEYIENINFTYNSGYDLIDNNFIADIKEISNDVMLLSVKDDTKTIVGHEYWKSVSPIRRHHFDTERFNSDLLQVNLKSQPDKIISLKYEGLIKTNRRTEGKYIDEQVKPLLNEISLNLLSNLNLSKLHDHNFQFDNTNPTLQNIKNNLKKEINEWINKKILTNATLTNFDYTNYPQSWRNVVPLNPISEIYVSAFYISNFDKIHSTATNNYEVLNSQPNLNEN